MKNLSIEWRHFESAGQTCQRCGDTGQTLKQVVDTLTRELSAKGIAVSLTETRLPASAMAQSNMLLFNGVPMEDLLDDVAVSTNECSSCSCLTGEDTVCRTLVHQGEAYEDIPAGLIRQAALKALDRDTFRGDGTRPGPLDEQNPHWEKTYAATPEMFGEAPSEPVRKAVELFRQEGKVDILELGAGQGRDTLYFARNGFQVHALDYSQTGLARILEKAQALNLSTQITVERHDVRELLPFANDSLDACYAHMLFCMALTTAELEFLAREIWRVLKPEGLCVYTVRHTSDPHYGTGIHRGEDMYEVGGFIVHFFSRDKVSRLAREYALLEVAEFEEGPLPKKLFRVTMRKK